MNIVADYKELTLSTEVPTQPIPVKLWLCPSGHVLGQVVRRGGIRRLELYRNAVEIGQAGQLMAVLTGSADNICCSICGQDRTWFAPEEGMIELLERLGR